MLVGTLTAQVFQVYLQVPGAADSALRQGVGSKFLLECKDMRDGRQFKKIQQGKMRRKINDREGGGAECKGNH